MTAFASAVSQPMHRVSYRGGDSLVSRAWSGVTRMIRLEITDDQIIVENDAFTLPTWVVPTVVRLFELQRLREDWDSYGGVPLQDRHRDAVVRFLSSVMTDDLVRPDIVPLADGGVQLEWRRDGLDVDFVSDEELSEPTLFVTHGDDTEEFEGLNGVSYFLHELRDSLRSTEGIPA
jgi:hypothetical protein